MGKAASEIDSAAAASASRTAFHRFTFVRYVWALPLALPLFAAAIYGAIRFPVVPLFRTAILLGYTALLWREPRLWMFFVPALLTISNLAPWSGRLFFDELDFFLLITVAVCALRRRTGISMRLAPTAAATIGFFVLVFVVSLGIGISPFEPIDANSFANYYSKYNGLRIGKSLLWGIVLLW